MVVGFDSRARLYGSVSDMTYPRRPKQTQADKDAALLVGCGALILIFLYWVFILAVLAGVAWFLFQAANAL